jgi:hypothetical protein
MPATVEAKTPVATTSRIIPPIMNETPDPRTSRASREQTVWHELREGGYCAADTGREKEAPCVFGELLERALGAFVREAKRW